MEKKLYRESSDKVMGGVAGGLARYFDIDVTWMRIFFILATIFGFSGLLIYVILWIAIPEKPFNWNTSATDYRVKDETVLTPESGMKKPRKKRDRSSPVGGFILIFLGMYFLLREFDLVPYWFSLHKLWPLVFLIPGLVILINSGRNSAQVELPAEDMAQPEAEQPQAEKPKTPVKKVVRKKKAD